MTTTNEPLVFGPADRRSVEQLRNRQQASGEPAEGVLCADHAHRRREPLRGPVRRRRWLGAGGRPLRQPRLRPQDGGRYKD